MQENRGTIRKEHWYEHVPKSVGTSCEGKLTIFWNHKVQTEPFLTINRTS